MTENITDHPQNTDLTETHSDSEVIPCLEADALTHYMKVENAGEQFDKILAGLQMSICAEVDGEMRDFDRLMIEQAALLDKAFRFYYSGGAQAQFTEGHFLYALKAQQQSSETLRNIRGARFQKQRFERDWELEQTRRVEKARKGIERDRFGDVKGTSKYYDPYKRTYGSHDDTDET